MSETLLLLNGREPVMIHYVNFILEQLVVKIFNKVD
jgi:hypothetical protein